MHAFLMHKSKGLLCDKSFEIILYKFKPELHRQPTELRR